MHFANNPYHKSTNLRFTNFNSSLRQQNLSLVLSDVFTKERGGRGGSRYKLQGPDGPEGGPGSGDVADVLLSR